MRFRRRRAESGAAQLAQLKAEVAALEAELDATRLDPVHWVRKRYVQEYGCEVRAGPFRGLAYPADVVDRIDALPAKLIGSYERELHSAIESAIAAAPPTFVNVGCGDGFYAAGFALASPATEVLGFDIDPDRRELSRRLATHNGVEQRVEIAARCEPSDLARLEPGAVVLLDCEGCELELLGDVAIAGLARAMVVVELHNDVTRAVTGAVTRRFESTHEIALVASEPRNIDDYPELAFFGWNNRQVAIWEFRPRPMRWAVLRPRG